MASGTLTIDLSALVANYAALRALCPGAEAAAVVKADGYGLGAGTVAKALAHAGTRRFFVATAEEGATLRQALGHAPEINVFSGHMAGDTALIRDANLTPMLNSPQQVQRHAALPDHPYGIQLDSGMHRLGIQPEDWPALRPFAANATLVMSHLACADEPDHPQNAAQLAAFRALTADIAAPKSLAATGGTLLGADYHFDLIRPGVGLYGGLPFAGAQPVVCLSLPVVQIRSVAPGGHVGYAASYTATTPRQIATVSSGYADGLIRAMSSRATLYDGDTPCPLIGRVSMDLLTVDVTDCVTPPEHLDILGPHQSVDQLADAAGTIGYEILTSLGPRYTRKIVQ